MFYQAYLRHKSLRDVLNRKFETARTRENASISIHDIIVRPKDSGYFGEAKAHRNFYKQEPIERLIDHIELLAQLANLYHEKNYCEQLADGCFQLKKTHLNTITRLATHEFFFCGAKPLRLSEFERVIQRVEEIASNCHYNLHLLLSSFSVVNDRDELLNAVLYVQCGKEVTMNIYCKRNATLKDVSYPGTAITSYQNFNEDQASAYVSQEAIENKQGTAISRYDPRLVSNNGLFEIETRGGARYIQAIDICLDHLTHHAKRLLLNQLSPDIAHERLLPEQVDHVVTSNTVELVEEAKTTASVLHVDAYYALPNERGHDYNFLIQNSDLAPIQRQSQYPLIITIRGNRLKIINPPFGSEYKLESYAPRKLGEFIPGIAQSIQLINQSTYRRQMDTLLRMNDPHLAKKVSEFASIETKKIPLFSLASELLQRFLETCKTSSFEYIFRKREYALKLAAKDILMSFMERLERLPFDDFLALLPNWVADLKYNIIHIDCGLPHDFIDEIIQSIDAYEVEIESSLPGFLAKK